MKLIKSLLLASALLSIHSQANTVRIGNGGDTQTGSFVSEEALLQAVFKTKTEAQLLLNSWISNENIKHLTLEQKKSLVSLIQTTPVELLTKDACHDGVSKKDAVAYASPKPKICVSVLQLKNKLYTDNYRNQILALMIHEYSHLIGFDENQANQLQQLVIQYISILGYPVAVEGPPVDDFILYNPYSIFEDTWNDKERLSEEITSYASELRQKITRYSEYSFGNYPVLLKSANYAPDILLRLNYIEQASKAYWRKPAHQEIRKQLDELHNGSGRTLDLIFFNNMEVNPSFQLTVRNDLEIPVLDQNTPESDFRKLILQIDYLKRTMEQQILSVLNPR
ncbi:hypothetical protein [Bdellovibrio sp. HCB288]|uniref:hypothetical protein n=1 Tax=Bdellovibrio sp. HCB288 TaxID=3394355 RepID=UPI0039B5AE72